MGIDISVPDGKSGPWEVKTFEITDMQAMMSSIRDGRRAVSPGIYKKLTRNNSVIMSNTSAEISDHREFINIAKREKSVLINGLGIGVALTSILESDVVEDVTIIEKSQDVVNLSGPTYAKDKRVNIIVADAFEWKPPKGKRYGAVWHDIWDNITSSNLREMTKLHRKYGRRADWQGSWARKECNRLKNS